MRSHAPRSTRFIIHAWLTQRATAFVCFLILALESILCCWVRDSAKICKRPMRYNKKVVPNIIRNIQMFVPQLHYHVNRYIRSTVICVPTIVIITNRSPFTQIPKSQSYWVGCTSSPLDWLSNHLTTCTQTHTHTRDINSLYINKICLSQHTTPISATKQYVCVIHWCIIADAEYLKHVLFSWREAHSAATPYRHRYTLFRPRCD